MTTRLAWLCLAATLCSSCLCPSAPPSQRLFTPALDGTAAGPSSTNTSSPELRLRHVTASEHLDNRMAYQRSSVEFGYHTSHLWNERPERFVERALGAALFESGRFRRSFATTAPALSVDLVHFEDVEHGERRVQLGFKVVLAGSDGTALMEQRFGDTASVSGDPEESAQVLGALLEAQAALLAEALAEVLAD